MEVVLVLIGLGLGVLCAVLAARWWVSQNEAASRAGASHVEGVDIAELFDRLRTDQSAQLSRAVQTVLDLAGDKLASESRAGAAHLDTRNEVISHELASLRGELSRVGEAMANLHRDRAEQHGQLVAGLRETVRQSANVAATAQSLREALSSTKARGQWGERLADDVLRLAGFVEGISYRRQQRTNVGSVPDFTFILPDALQLHMDVKFPLDNYLRYLETGGDAPLTQFLRDVRARVRELSGRGYIRPGETLDYVLLFIPNEAVFGFIHEHDPAFADFALSQKVVLCSPFTLFAVLAVIRQATESFMLQSSTDEILRALGHFSNQWDKFSEAVDVLGKRLDSSQRAFEELAGTRRRQMQKMVDKVDDLRRQRAIGEGETDVAAVISPLSAPLSPVPLRPPSLAPSADLGELSRRLTG